MQFQLRICYSSHDGVANHFGRNELRKSFGGTKVSIGLLDQLKKTHGITWRKVTGSIEQISLDQLEKAHGTTWRKLTGPLAESSRDHLEKAHGTNWRKPTRPIEENSQHHLEKGYWIN